MPTAPSVSQETAERIKRSQKSGQQPSDSEVINILNEASNFNWSFSTDETPTPSRRIGEVAPPVANTGDLPEITIHAHLVIHADDHNINRSGSATGSRNRQTDPQRQAIAAAIRTFASF